MSVRETGQDTLLRDRERQPQRHFSRLWVTRLDQSSLSDRPRRDKQPRFLHRLPSLRLCALSLHLHPGWQLEATRELHVSLTHYIQYIQYEGTSCPVFHLPHAAPPALRTCQKSTTSSCSCATIAWTEMSNFYSHWEIREGFICAPQEGC